MKKKPKKTAKKITKNVIKNISRKDPKKVKAGKARASKAIRINGRFASKDFVEVLKKDAEIAGIPQSKIYEFFLQNEREYTDNAELFRLTTFRNYEQIKRDIKGYKGTIIYNGRKIKKETALLNLTKLNQYLKSEHDFYTFWFSYEKKLNGQIKITVPTVRKLEKEIEEKGNTVDEILKKKGVKFMRSTDPNTYTPAERKSIRRKNAKTKK